MSEKDKKGQGVTCSKYIIIIRFITKQVCGLFYFIFHNIKKGQGRALQIKFIY